MEALLLGLMLLIAVLLSSVIDQVVPRISLPLIQIALGLIITIILPGSADVELDPELFLVLFIAPLLYVEAKDADKHSLYIHLKPILSLAIGLVVATVLIVGFSLHALIPSIPLAAAFALGGALGPTDAVAVTSLSKTISIPNRQKSILKGEYLLNDASGIVSFQFALAAVITGTFSLVEASIEFLIEFFGGLAAGIVLGLLFNFFTRRVRAIGVENTTFHVLFEISTPLIIFLISDAIHVSGIIAVVVAGLLNVISPGTVTPSVSRMNIVSTSVWQVLAFALNGVVFVLLGTQLSDAMRTTWDDASINNFVLIGYIFILTFLVMGPRFIWILIMDWIHVHRGAKRKFTGRDLKLVLANTLSGAKGTITLSILFTIPIYTSFDPIVRFPQRDLIIFLACGVIVLTLVMATFIVPVLVPRGSRKESEEQRQKRDARAAVAILRNVIEELTAKQTPETRQATQIVIRSYNTRIANIQESNDLEPKIDNTLRLQAIQWEQVRTMELMQEGSVSGVIGYRYLRKLEHIRSLITHNGGNGITNFFARVRAMLRRGIMTAVREIRFINLPESTEESRKLQLETTNYAIEKLEALMTDGSIRTEEASALLMEFQRLRTTLTTQRANITAQLKTGNVVDEVRQRAFAYELEQIQAMYEAERLSRVSAQYMRENVNLMQFDIDANLEAP